MNGPTLPLAQRAAELRRDFDRSFAEPPRSRPPDGRTDRLADPDAEEDSQQHDERPDRRLEQRQRLFEGWQQDDDEAATGYRPEEPDHLRQGPGAEPDHHRDDQDDDHEEVEQVHERSMAPNVGAGPGPTTYDTITDTRAALPASTEQRASGVPAPETRG